MLNQYAQSALNLLFVLIIMFVLMYVLKKFRFAKFATNNHMKIINTISIGGKEKILLLEVNKTFLLIGATPNHIETLHVFNELEPQLETVPSSTAFKEQLAALK